MQSSRKGRRTKSKANSKAATKNKRGLTAALSEEAQLVWMVALAILVFLIYANSLQNEFVFDDIYLVATNEQIRSLNFSLFVNSYRPLRDISYALDFAVWGESPFGFHLTNMLLHIANVLLVFWLVRKLSLNLATAVIAAAIFAVHPLQTDAVAYISGRRDLLFSFFYLLACHAYFAYYRTKVRIRSALYFLLFLFLWFLSLLSKEMAASLPIFLFVWHVCDAWETGPSIWRQVVGSIKKTIARDRWFWLLLITTAIAYSIYWAFGRGASRRAGFNSVNYWGGSFYLNILTVIRVHSWYLKQLIFPTPIAQYLGAFEISRTILDWRFVVSALVVGGTLVAGFVSLNRRKLIAFAIFSYFVLLLPVSQIIPHHELLADHYLYLPIMSFGLIVGVLAERIGARSDVAKKVAYLTVTAAVLIFGVMTVVQNRTWKNERTLWTANYEAVPNSPRAALNLGNTYQDTEPKKAEELFKKALGLNPPPEIRRTLNDRLVVLLIQQQKFDEAAFFVSEVLARSPRDFFGNLWATQVHMYKNECTQAREKLEWVDIMAGNDREKALAQETRRQLALRCK